MNLTQLGICSNASMNGMLLCSFLNTSMNLVNCLSYLFCLKRWGYGTGALGSAVTACFSVSFFPFDVSAGFSS